MTSAKGAGVKILRLSVRDFCRLSAVEINAAGESVVLSGKNAQGKSSAMQAVACALLGSAAVPAKPVREGAKEAEVVLTIGAEGKASLVIRRVTDGEKEKLVVENGEGFRQTPPQRAIDALLGACIDPVAFASPPGAKTEEAADRERLRMLAEIAPLPIDLAVWKAGRDATYASRTAEARRLKEVEARLSGMPEIPVPARVDVSDLAAKLSAANAAEAAREKAEDAVNAEEATLALRNERANEALRALSDAQDAVAARSFDLKRQGERVEAAKTALAAMPAPENTDAIRARIGEASTANEAAANAEERNRSRAATKKDRDTLASRVAGLSDALAKADAEKSAALASVAMPAEGLSITEDGVLLNGRPFRQASTSEQIRASVRVAAAKSGALRVILVRDGNALDSDSIAELLAFAKDAGLQLWIERVAKDVPGSVEIVDGSYGVPPADPAVKP